jgi:hypothetical protein
MCIFVANGGTSISRFTLYAQPGRCSLSFVRLAG